MSATNFAQLKRTRNSNPKYHYAIGPSGLHGIGIFASKALEPGDVVSVFLWFKSARPNTFIRDESCRFCNHSSDANCTIKKSGKDYLLVAKSKINKDDEIFINYMDTVRHLLTGGLFSLPSMVRCRTFEYMPFLKDKKNRTLLDELKEISAGSWS